MPLTLRMIPDVFAVCKVSALPAADSCGSFVFTARTDKEISLVCASEYVPAEATEREDGWRMFVIDGVLDFGMVGVIAGISGALAENGIPIFVVSTFNTDYLLVKEEHHHATIQVLEQRGYAIDHGRPFT